MEGFINSIGGYESWQFATLMLGSVFIGLGLYLFKRYFVFIPAVGVLLTYFYLNNLLTKIADADKVTIGAASVIPIIATATLILILVAAWNRKGKSENHT